MSEIKLLIVEDEDAQIQIYEDTLHQYNKKNDLKINYEVFKDFNTAAEALNTPSYDAAIIDLKLSNSEELEGKNLVLSVYQKIRIPIIIYSGSLAQIDDIKENALLKKRLRTELFKNIIDEVILIYNTGITSFLRPNGIVDNKLTDIFWNHLSQDLDIWIKHNNSNTLLRYILSHFLESLEINLDGDFEEYHPHEVYIKPPIKKNLHTGDIIKIDKELFILLTPACDVIFNTRNDASGNQIQFRKADTMLLAPVKDFSLEVFCLNNKMVINKSKVSDFVKNKDYRYHYLPPYMNENGYIVDFQEIKSVKFDQVIERIATISQPFIKDIISRFANYYSRQGQPTFDQDSIIENLMQKSQKEASKQVVAGKS